MKAQSAKFDPATDYVPASPPARTTTYKADFQNKPPKRFPIDRSGIRYIARTVDVAAIILATYIGALNQGVDILALSLIQALPFVAAPIAAFFAIRMTGGYWFAYEERALTHLSRAVWGAMAGMGAIIAISIAIGMSENLMALVHAANLSLLTIAGLHVSYAMAVHALTETGQLSDNVVIVGATNAASQLIARNKDERELNVVGIFDDRLDRAPKSIEGVDVIGTVDDLLEWDRLPDIDRVVVTVTSTAQKRVRTLIDRLRALPQEVILVLDLDGFAPESTSVGSISDSPAAYISGAPKDARRAAVKRAMDIGLGSLMLAGFAPIMAIVAVLIKLDSPGPVFFRQKRHGFNNQIIRVWKFRTMRPDKAAEEGKIVQTQSNDDRVTKIGKFLRKTSLDELPQLLNIIAGEMSLVGPRPHAVGMTSEETEVHNIVGEYAHRHRMKPGLTGWAQINGSRGPVHTKELVRERVRLDMEYVEKASFWFDFYVILMTAPCLLGDSKVDR